MNSLNRLTAAVKTEPSIRAIARKARVSNNQVVAHLKTIGKPIKATIRLSHSHG